MKQTNNAIKFLMAQYRAIFKNANIAMVAAMAAAALAAGQASAAPNDATLDLGNDAANAQASDTINSAVSISGSSGGYIDELIIASGGTLTFDGSATATKNTGHIRVGNTLTVQSGGSLVVKGSGDQISASGGSGFGIIGTYDNKESYDDKNSTLNVDGGSVTLSASQIQMNNVVLNNATVTVEKNIADLNGKDSDFSDNAQINAVKGALGGGEFTVKGENSNIKLNSGSIFNAHTFNLEDGQITMSGTNNSGEAAIIRAYGGGVVNLKGTDITTSGSGNYIGGEGGVNMSAGNVTVAGSSVLHISGKLDKSGNLADAQKPGEINVTGGKITVANGGLLKLNGNATFASGTVVNSGTIEAVSGSKINANGNEGLYSKDGQLKLTGATLNFTGASLDLSDAAANISGNASSTVLAENANVTIGNGFEDKAPTVVAGTLTVKGEVSAAPDASYQNRPFLVIESGNVTALNEVKGSPKNTEIAVYNKTKGGSATLTLGNAQTTNGKLTDIARVYVGVGAAGKDSTNTLNVNGKWDFANAKLAVGNKGTLNINEGAEVSNIERLQIHGNNVAAKNTVNVNGTLKIKRLLAAESQTTGGDVINVKGTLEIQGDGKDNDASTTTQGKFDNDVQLTKATLNIKAGGTVSLATKDAWDDVLKVTTNSDTDITTFEVQATGGNTADFGGWDKSKVKLNAGGTLRIDLSGYKVADKTALDTLAGALKADSNGLIDFGGLSIGKVDKNNDGTIELDNMPTVKTKDTQDLEVNLGRETTLNQSYSMGSANVSGNSLTIGTGSTVEFNKAKNGQFANNTADAGSKVNVTLSANSALKLNGNGSLGDIKQSGSGTAAVLGGNNGTQTVGAVDVATLNIIVGGKVTSKAVTIAAGATVNGVLNAAGAVSAKTLSVGDSGAIHAAGQSITVSDANAVANILGDVEAGTLSLSGGALIAGGADVKLDSLKGATDTTIQVGEDREGGLGATVTTTNLVLNGGSIFVDPEFGTAAGFVVTENLSNAGSTTSGSGTLDGKAYVGKNAALGIGFAKTDAGLAELKAVVAPYLVDNGGFAENGVKNALVINDSVTVASGNGFVVNHELTSTNYTTSAPNNEIKLGAGAALVVTDKALDEGAKAAVTFSNTNGTASITADQTSKVVLVGDFTTADNGEQIFAAVNSGNNSAGTVTGSVDVVAAGGLLEGKITNGSIASLDLNKDAEKAIRSEVSAPVGQLFVDFANGKFHGATGAGYDFVVDAISYKQFKAVDAAAHAATYAGAQQAAVASVTTMADAMFGRVGAVGVEAASIAATGSQANGGVWLTPMYKSVDADGFNAEGASYGSEVDLGGVAFGADTVNGNMRFGAVFNIGSGDADGKGQGNGLKDEFDYYGFGIYSAMGFGNLALVGDASLSVISHDVEGLGLKGKADTTAVTMGLTGQYTVATPAVDVTPHLGARFIRLNTDSYDLVGAKGAIATTDFDVQNVFSVPLGVTLSKGFTTGGWTLAPSADLTITFNGGDTEAKSSTTFTGIKAINMNTEVLDEVTYGVTLGLGAQYGAFGTSFGINYTGSENTDSFGVNAQARYMF